MPRARDAREDDTGIILGMLSAVEQDNGVTQRRLARELNIALGLANAYLKRCARKGFIGSHCDEYAAVHTAAG
jgi:hypothetical protein